MTTGTLLSTIDVIISKEEYSLKILRFVLSTVIFLSLFSGCAGKSEPVLQTDPVESASSSVTVPVEIQMVDSSKLPAGYEVQELESGRLQIREKGKIIGAIDIYPIPKDTIFDPYYR